MNDSFGSDFLKTLQILQKTPKNIIKAYQNIPSKYFQMHYEMKWINLGPELFSGIINFKTESNFIILILNIFR